MEKFNTFNFSREIISPLTQFEINDLISLDAPTHLSGKQNTTWVKLSNSGDTLELQVPSYIRKDISGWTNYSCTVTSLKASEKNVGYRGSKSVNIDRNITVKEQRVDGSWYGNRLSYLRYTLMGFERNYQVKIPFSHLFAKQYSTNSIISSTQSLVKSTDESVKDKSTLINPFFITGLTDGEGSFMISVKKSLAYRQHWKVQALFVITLHKKDLELLKRIQSFFGGIGSIDRKGEDILQFRIFSIEQITNIIIPHFDKYQLLTQKKADFELFKLVVKIMNQKRHLTQEGLEEIVNFKASMNKGLSKDLKEAFPNTGNFPRPLVKAQKIKDPYWLAGFTSGEGCFYIKQRQSGNDKKIIEVIFIISQHSRDEYLMESLVNYLGSGRISKSKNAVYYTCSRFTDIWDKILPFFNKFEVLGAKSSDFKKWCKVCKIVKSKDHLTNEGFNQIREIKASMNVKTLKR
jgi:hypothetical protein